MLEFVVWRSLFVMWDVIDYIFERMSCCGGFWFLFGLGFRVLGWRDWVFGFGEWVGL